MSEKVPTFEADLEASTKEEPPRKRRRSTTPLDETSVTNVTAAQNGTQKPQEALKITTPSPALPQTNAPSPDRWDVSFFGIEPVDECTRHVAEWLYARCKGRQNVEIEAKIGILVGLGQGNLERLKFPVETETILREPSSTRFESIMTLSQHKAFNRLLNERVEQQRSPDYRGPRLLYQHLREIDRFFPAPGKGRIRVTTDALTGQIKTGGIIHKQRIDDLNVFSPKHAFDFRISVNVEDPAEMPRGPANLSRSKDRVSYQYDLFKIDLTQVSDPPADIKMATLQRHELEIELLRPDVLVYEGDLFFEGKGENHFLHLVQIFLNNVRMLIRNASDP